MKHRKSIYIDGAKGIYELVHQSSDIGLCLNKRWGLGDTMERWLWWCQSIWKARASLSIKFGVGYCFETMSMFFGNANLLEIFGHGFMLNFNPCL